MQTTFWKKGVRKIVSVLYFFLSHDLFNEFEMGSFSGSNLDKHMLIPFDSNNKPRVRRAGIGKERGWGARGVRVAVQTCVYRLLW